MTHFVEVTDSTGRNVLVNLAHVSAVVDDEDMPRLCMSAPGDWNGDGCIEVPHLSYRELRAKILAGGVS